MIRFYAFEQESDAVNDAGIGVDVGDRHPASDVGVSVLPGDDHHPAW